MPYIDVKSTEKLPATALPGEAIFDKDAGVLYVGQGEADPLVQINGTGTAPTGSGNKVLATPSNGSSGVSALRALVLADLPSTALRFVAAPATASSAGVAGQIAFDATNLYVCVATNTWVSTVLATF